MEPANTSIDQYILELEDSTPADEERTSSYFSELKTYFLTGKKTREHLTKEVYPIQLALQQKEAATDEELTAPVEMPFDFNGTKALQMLNLQTELRGNLNLAFLKTLKKTTTGLNELLMLHGDGANLSVVQMDFADDLISFDKLRDITVSTVSSQLPKSRLQRLSTALQTLSTARESYAPCTATIFTSEAINKSFDLEHIFNHADIVVSATPCHQAYLQSKKEVNEFVNTIAALKMGNLMIDQKYDDSLHDDYFDQFDLAHLTEDDLKYLHPILVIEDARHLRQQSKYFLNLLSRNSFVKVLGINLLDDLFAIQNQDEADYLELASLAIFRRNSYVFQGGIDLPSALEESYKKGMDFPGSVFWNILIPSGKMEDDPAKNVLLTAAIESRYFPRMEYEADGNDFAGNKIGLQNNTSPDADFVTYEQKIKSPSGVESAAITITIADFLAMDSKLRETLEIIPPDYQNGNLIPLIEYLSQSQEFLSGKIPFIWLVDEQLKLRKAAIPVFWIQKCRNRLEYWHFLQSLSGVNKAQLQSNIDTAKTEWEKAKNTEIEALRAQFEKARSSDIQEAVVRMLNGLLNQDGNIESVLTAISKEEFKPVVEARQEPASPAGEQTKKEDEEEISTIREEVWVESDECTSCKDCIDALPSVFKYNANKQAYVHNPKGGTFAQIVKAAEKCPAKCIHPGVPQNKNEASLEQWMKRAEKFN